MSQNSDWLIQFLGDFHGHDSPLTIWEPLSKIIQRLYNSFNKTHTIAGDGSFSKICLHFQIKVNHVHIGILSIGIKAIICNNWVAKNFQILTTSRKYTLWELEIVSYYYIYSEQNQNNSWWKIDMKNLSGKPS